MEYSTDDIAAARSLQFTTFSVHGYILVCRVKYTFLLRSHWTRIKGLFIVTRYLPFIFLAVDLYLYFTPDENPGKCRVLDNVRSGLGIVLITLSECISRPPGIIRVFDLIPPDFFALRTYVLWNKNRTVRATIACTSIAIIVASFSFLFTTSDSASYVTSAIPRITGCYLSASRYQLSIPYLLFSVFTLELMILTLIRAVQDWRKNSGRLYTVLVKHNIFYYACGFLLSTMNVFMSLFLQYSYQTILYDFQYLMLPILATRMHLHFWKVDQHAHDSGTVVSIPMSDMSFANFTA
ncbi:uncharacterized protein EDB93DRAFT_1340388 [Suillus bovinus]|uniref:uncharacterized protein n=1 Tax=Suillus bovinus TaxID=48563 RepID=UPI001B8725D4|nr:uncharacterized protein EDB93DRAFT_1340388 [Suillus bovinus]KAG2130795.1 hypothetical protein EDB93DRAFT_1340388 [Suillus bovinus]